MSNVEKISYRVLKEIHKHSPRTKIQLAKKFKRDLTSEIDALWKNQFIENPITGLDKDNNLIVDYDTYLITQQGKAYIDTRVRDDRRWMIPMIMSAVALIISIIALFKP